MATDNDKTTNGKGSETRVPEIKDSLRAPLPKRFYKSAATAERDGGFAVTLDGRSVKTPGRKRELVVPDAALAETIAEEWNRQGEHIDPATMPLTRLVNSAIEAVSERMTEVRDDIVAFAGSDLLCYRAETPAALVARQKAAWDPVLAWAKQTLAADFKVQHGLMPIDQPVEATQAIAETLTDLDALCLSAVHILTTITGSAILAVAYLKGRLTADEVWAAATIDEMWQREQWGQDDEAQAHTAKRLAEFTAASLCLRLLHPPR